MPHRAQKHDEMRAPWIGSTVLGRAASCAAASFSARAARDAAHLLQPRLGLRHA